MYFRRRIGLTAQFRMERFRRDAYITGIGRADFFQIYLVGGQHAETACVQTEKEKKTTGQKNTGRKKMSTLALAYVRLPLHKVITQPCPLGTSLGITFKTISAGSGAKTVAALFRG